MNLVESDWRSACLKGTLFGIAVVLILVLLELLLVEAGGSTQDSPSFFSYLLYPGVWLVLTVLGWEADFSGISVILGILIDIVLWSTGATFYFAVSSRKSGRKSGTGYYL